MNDKVNHWFLHIDLDAFFASVEQLDHPEYRGKPVIVGGKPEDRRSVVSTASYEARKFGVHSAMPTFMAYKLCPQGIFVHGRMERYQELSYQVMSIFKDFSPDVDQMSIDEAFIDLTGTEKLFGPPEETAKKIKERVKTETGLTVSIGLATSKYIAKIASGFSKPDGFYFVKPGTEQDFMLNLPLEKIWGCGKKTLELLHKYGINTTTELYEKDLDYLSFFFGKNTANFLYNSVRGLETECFSKNPKKHSISAERTFSYDIYDGEIAKNYIMEMSHNVVFRLLREKSYSKTITLKIRYNDFTTTSIQQTFDNYILTLDSFYEQIVKLFEKKYEVNRGIRLLGVGFDNVETKKGPVQLELFEDNSEKKQKIEMAILNLEQKHPEIKIHKARILNKTNKILIFVILAGLFWGNKNIYAQNINEVQTNGAGTILPDSFLPPQTSENPQNIFDSSLSPSANFDFLVSGYWLAEFTTSYLANFGKTTDFYFSNSSPIFKQEVDLYTWTLFNNHFYFEADFSDEFKKNTFAIGYEGDNNLKSARFSNRKITMPAYYSANLLGYGLSGGENQAPGVSLHFEDDETNRWKGDFLLRYDMTKLENMTFYGKNKVTDTTIPLENFIRGQSFTLPENSLSYLQDIKDIYVENTNGTYIDNNKKKYIKLSTSQYLIFAKSGKIILSPSAKAGKQSNWIPRVLITFNSDQAVNKILSDTGSYEDNTSYAGRIQSFFNSINNNIKLQEFAFSPTAEIEKLKALVVQNNSGFSPYEISNTYDCGILSDADTFVASKTTENRSTEYSTTFISEEINSGSQDFLAKNHQYVQILNSNFDEPSLQNPEVRYPFANIYPQLYLGIPFETDLMLFIRNYSAINEFNIGTDIAENTVKVYINGILDTQAHYDSQTGCVEPSKVVTDTDKVYIVWEKDTEDYSGGTIAAGTGFVFNFKPNLIGDISLTLHWPLAPELKYATPESPMTGFSALSTGIDYSTSFGKNFFKLTNKTAFSLQNENSTGILLVSSQENTSSKTYYLSKSDGYITKTIPYIEDSLELTEEGNGTILEHNGIQDSAISGYKIPLQWDFSNSNSSTNWAAVDINLSTSNIAKGSEFEIAIQPYTLDSTDYDIYLQLGINAGNDFWGEESTSIPHWKISEKNQKTKKSLDLTKNNWQTVKILLTQADRAKLQSYQDARLIIIQKNQNAKSGIIYVGPYEPQNETVEFYCNENIEVKTQNVKSKAPSAKDLIQNEGYSTELKWNIFSEENLLSAKDYLILAAKYFNGADFSNYKTINFDFAYNGLKKKNIETLQDSEEYQLRFVLDSEAKNTVENGKTALDLELYNLEPYISTSLVYHTLSINLFTNKVYIDDVELDKKSYSLFINKGIIPSREKIFINTNINENLYTQGEFYIDNLYYKESSPYLAAQNKFELSYENNTEILNINHINILKNAKINLKSDQNFSYLQNKNIDNNTSASLYNYASGEITITNINFFTDVSTQIKSEQEKKDIISSATYNISTEKDLFKSISFNSSYNYNHQEESIKKSDELFITLHQIKLPLTFYGKSSAGQNNNIQSQIADFGTLFDLKIRNYEANLSLSTKVSQKINTATYAEQKINVNDFFNNWYNISNLEFSIGDKNASSRKTEYSMSFSNSIPFIKLKPTIEYNISSQFTDNFASNFSDITQLSLKVPFGFKNNNFYFNLIHTGSGLQQISTVSYIDDTTNLFELYSSRLWFYKAIPFYELFSSDLKKSFVDFTQNCNEDYINYTAQYEVGWSRRLSNSIIDLFVPSNTSFALGREIKSSDTISDLYQIKTVITNTSINNFGKFSSLQLFNWFEQDEVITSLTTVFKIPTDIPELLTYQITAYGQILFFLNQNDTLKTATDFTIENDNNWDVRFSTVWSRHTKNSLIASLVSFILKRNFDYSVVKKETFNVSTGNYDTVNRQFYEYNHAADLSFLKYFTVTTGFGINFNYEENGNDSIGLKLNLGGRMEF